MNRQDLATAIRQTLGDHPDTFDIEGITDEIGNTYGYDIKSLDTIPGDEYWQIVKRHDPNLPSA